MHTAQEMSGVQDMASVIAGMGIELDQAFGSTKQMREIIERIYAAAEDPALWESVLEPIARLIGAGDIELFGGSNDLRAPGIAAVHGIDPVAWSEYAEYYAGINPLMQRCATQLRPDEIWRNEKVFADGELEKTEFYQDFFRRWDMHYSCGLQMSGPDEAPIALSAQRPLRRGPFDQRLVTVYEVLRPHLVRAVKLHRRLRSLEAETVGLGAALDAAEQAVLCVDASGKVTMVNAGAAKLLDAGDTMRIGIGGQLVCAATSDTVSLRKLLHDRLAVAGRGVATMQVQRRGQERAPLNLTMLPLSGGLPGSGIGQASMLVFLGDPDRAPRSRSDVMRSLYGLTPAEGRVCDGLLEGLETREVAERMKTTLETARFHMKQILRKTGVGRQSELVRLMMGLPTLS